MGNGSKITGNMPACGRCTALLHGNQGRCSLCGWPVGSAYPPGDGAMEQSQVAVAADASPQQPAADEAVGVQLDALTAMVVRHHDRSTADLEPTAQIVAAEPQLTSTESESMAEATPGLVLAHASVSHVTTDVESVGAIVAPDPLTAPLDQLAPAHSIDTPDNESWPADDDLLAAEGGVTTPGYRVVVDESADAVRQNAQPQPQTTRLAGVMPLGRIVQTVLLMLGVTNLVLAGFMVVAAPVDDATVSLGQALTALGLALLTLALWLTAAGLFLVWVSRAYTHVTRTSPYKQRHSRGMAVAGWLIPVYGLVVGWNVLCDLWTGSDPATRDRSSEKPTQPTLVVVWLVGLIGSSAFGFALPRVLGESPVLNAVGAVCLLVSALALGKALVTISGWQSLDATPERTSKSPTAAE